MDTISVLSSVIKKDSIENTINKDNHLQIKLNRYNKKSKYKTNQINFSNLKNWKIGKNSIYHKEKNFYQFFFLLTSLQTLEKLKIITAYN